MNEITVSRNQNLLHYWFDVLIFLPQRTIFPHSYQRPFRQEGFGSDVLDILDQIQ